MKPRPASKAFVPEHHPVMGAVLPVDQHKRAVAVAADGDAALGLEASRVLSMRRIYSASGVTEP